MMLGSIEASARPMSLARAFKVATADTEHPIHFVGDEEKNWKAARAVLLAHNYCPSCACGGHRVKLDEWQPGDYWSHAGKACPDCEEFVVCGEQPEYGDASDEWRGDANPGL